MNLYRSSLAVLLITCALQSCKTKQHEPVWGDLPEARSLATLRHTTFAVTLESTVDQNTNVIYAPTLLYAWEELKPLLSDSITLSSDASTDLSLLNSSTAHRGALRKDEYAVDPDISGREIRLRAFFNKSLLFETSFNVRPDSLLFDNLKVAAFGIDHYDSALVAQCQIVYYKDDDHFMLALVPADRQHEILLAKGLLPFLTLKDALRQIDDLVKAGQAEQTERQHAWKYQITDMDQVAIPVVEFNLESNIKTLEGQAFTTGDEKHHLEEVYQRNGFILDEHGAVAESEGMIAVDSVAAEPEASHPKRLAFDKPFMIALRRAGAPYPYFVVTIANHELLRR